MDLQLFVVIMAIGAGVGFLSGLFGKGGSAVATPLLTAAGVPPLLAVASPLPATIPTTLAAASAYWRKGCLEHRVFRLTLVWGIPATILGAALSGWVSAGSLVLLTDVLVAGIGVRVLLLPSLRTTDDSAVVSTPAVAVVAVVVGLLAGLLANSGGALLAPLYLTVLHLPIKRTFATSLSAATVLALPATVIHAALGHIDWTIVAVFGLASVPFSVLGARVAVRSRSERLERGYGLTLAMLGAVFLAQRFW
jgi:uncharacterized membrane protein YfcA